MTIDERLEALTQSVELLASMHRDNEQRTQRNEERSEKQDQRLERMLQGIERVHQRHTHLESLVADIAEGTARLLHVAEVHEEPISRLENRS